MPISGVEVKFDENFNLIHSRIVNMREFVDEFGEISLTHWNGRFWPIFQKYLIETRRTEILVNLCENKIKTFG